jgi:hypothetical protein
MLLIKNANLVSIFTQVNRDVYVPAAAQLEARQRTDSFPRVVFTILLPTSMGKARPLLVFAPKPIHQSCCPHTS